MSRPDSELPMDRSMARATVRLVVGGLILIALLPPLLWVAFGVWDEARHLGLHHSLQPLATSALEIGAASSLLALALWALVFQRRVRAVQAAERRLRATSKRDALTGLLNRDGLRIALARALQRKSGPHSDVGVLLIDIDRFHLVNNSLGQPAGDALLRSVAGRIRGVVRERDVVARIGGDQFAVQVEGVSGPQALAVMARNLLRAFESTYAVGGRDMVATLSIGIAMAGQAAQNIDQLLKNAEIAMRAAKAGGGGAYRSFEDHMRVDDELRLDLDRRLRSALKNGEFALVFQPITESGSERIVAVEALLRWADPAHEGLVSPAEFIPVLEQTGLIVAVGNWVLHQACRQGLQWLAGGSHSLVLSVNVSPRQFAEPHFVDSVTSILRDTGFPPSRLQLEVTEGLLLEPTAETLEKINALVNAGVRLAVDDFGMGYSSLAYLKSLPLHTLKIDRMFVRDAVEHPRDATIVRAIVDLGHGLGLHVTAEGVETEAQRKLLEQLGVDSMQGYLFARPVAAEAMTAMLAERGSAGSEDEPPTNWSSTMAALLHPA
jgi:diguanylate cyclase (GGDEF)-like protein